jgi:uncharacterized membrane protein HdeD (DUF308 family)
VVGLVITFSANHTPQLGLVAFGAFAVLTGLALCWGAFRLSDRVLRGVSIAQGAVSALLGVAALAFTTSGLGLLLFLVTAFAAVTGFLELYAGLRARGRHPSSRDWLAVGGFTAVAALVFLLIPLDSVQTVGLIGAYGILVGLFLVIAGLSLKWASPDAAVQSAAGPGATVSETSESKG